MGIIEEDIARVRAASDFVAIASEHIALKRVGRNYSGLCPFHSEKSPSFSISPEKGVYFCYGCGAKGDVITFVRDLERLDFAAAVEKLAAKANIQLRYDNEAAGKDRVRRTKLLEAMTQAVEWYHQRLLTSPDAGPARSYLRSRGYDGEAIRRFKIGWAPAGWDLLTKALNLPTDVAKDTGLGYVNKIGKLNDFFQSRILFPIFDVSGAPIAFGGRKMPDADGPKYKNSAESKIYSKSRTLYGLNWAKAGIVEAGEVIVCEGYTDVIGFHRAGLPRAVATCGTALADEHFRMLKNYARRIVLAYDADNAGQNAAAKFYAWEKAFEIDLYVVALPPGADPADVARSDPDRLQQAVVDAKPFLQFRIERLLAAANLRTPEGRARAYEAAASAIWEHPNALVREQYLRQVAAQCQISEETMARTLATRPAPSADAAGANGRRPRNQDRQGGPRNQDRQGRTRTDDRQGGPRNDDRSARSPARSSEASGRPVDDRQGPARAAQGSATRERLLTNEDPGWVPPPDDSAAPDDGDDFDADFTRDSGDVRGDRRPGPNDRAQARTAASSRGQGARRLGRASSAVTRSDAAAMRGVPAEEEALRWALAQPEAVVPWLDSAFFADEVHAEAFDLLVAHGDLREAADAVDAMPDETGIASRAISLLHRLAVETPVNEAEEAEEAIGRIVSNATARVLAELSSPHREPTAEDVQYITQLKHLLDLLNEPRTRTGALNQLVPWLSAWARQQRSGTPPPTT